MSHVVLAQRESHGSLVASGPRCTQLCSIPPFARFSSQCRRLEISSPPIRRSGENWSLQAAPSTAWYIIPVYSATRTCANIRRHRSCVCNCTRFKTSLPQSTGYYCREDATPTLAELRQVACLYAAMATIHFRSQGR
jgi:hypothetical protein